MIDIEKYTQQLIDLLKQQFGSKLLYVGLQGSYLRGEATQSSDIDIMVVLEELGIGDMDRYRAVISTLDHGDKSCGFICAKADLANWNPMEMHHLLCTTKDYFGILRGLLPPYTQQDIRNFVKMSVNNLYHEICHRYIHSKDPESMESLTASYKAVFFILQNLYYLNHGEFVGTKAALVQLLEGNDRAVLERSVALNNGAVKDFSESFQLLFTWCQDTLRCV